MESVFIIATILYLLSCTGYLGYLFFQREPLQRMAMGLMLTGFVLHSIYLVVCGLRAGNFPVNNLHETLSVTAWAIAAVFLAFSWGYKLKILGIYAAPLISMTMVAAHHMPDTVAQDPRLFKSWWLAAHIITAFLGNAAFALGGGLGLLYLLQENAIKKKIRGFFFSRLPSLELLDTTGYACIVAGFSMITIGLITGVIYAKAVWGRFWSWDPKEVWAAITWLFYAALLHERLTVGWRGRRAAIMAMVGFGVLLFTFFGVNFLLKGHHGTFTAM
ncbi:c-type cytochrome biogenesis protein CcsB [Desulfosarcina ovata subsp. sediminis]|uniref:C-type cytochrome biogenesis protein CcsB n=1 Tax=Desulfosarcina ovata subsp. sediminis TaxID=885957 RepID=A0A5K7ZU51_9BACT|nr:c-type cytochrome biogenesis protein CcsB [Desulfosarcina ovata]BBO83753.1 c-type cytochrome biogenesis protein CcsB [Desulfosarcina ovata subsp. sediminis]